MQVIDDLKKNLTHSDYNELLADFVKYFQSKKYFMAVGQFGNITFPGISDIDVLLLINTNFLKEAYQDYNEWIGDNTIKKYCFFHPPVFVTPEMLPFIKLTHTLYGFRVLKKKASAKLSIKNENGKILNLAWTTFLIATFNSILNHKSKISARKSLLILKNLHQSEENLGGRNNALDYSKQLREDALSYDNKKEVLREGRKTLKNIFELIDKKAKNNGKITNTNISFHISRKVELVRSNKSYLSKGDIYINSYLFDKFVKTFRWNKLDPEVKTYYAALASLEEINSKEGINPSFVSPFSYPFYKPGWLNSLKGQIKKYLH